MSRMVEVKTADLIGPALDWAWQKVSGKKATNTVQLLPDFARVVIAEELGDVVQVPAELLQGCAA